MAQSAIQAQASSRELLLSLLKVDNKGWNIALFEDTGKASGAICTHCASVCCDAVELGCDHDDEDISLLYCHQCLLDLIDDNHHKCPINSHEQPIIDPNRSLRRQILKSTVNCPFSSTYKARAQQFKLARRAQQHDNLLLDTSDLKDAMDANEGNDAAPNLDPEPIKTCQWSGTMKQLLNQHLAECIKQQDPSYEYKTEIVSLKAAVSSLRTQNERYCEENNKLKLMLKTQQNISHKLRRENQEMKLQIHEQTELIQSMLTQTPKLKPARIPAQIPKMQIIQQALDPEADDKWETDEEDDADEMDYFLINSQSSFQLIGSHSHARPTHLFGARVVDSETTTKYEWKIKVDKAFGGCIGVIDDTQEVYKKVQDGKWTNSADVLMVANRDWWGVYWGKEQMDLNSFFHAPAVIEITLDFATQIVCFRNPGAGKSVSKYLRYGTNRARLIVQFWDLKDTVVQIVK